MTRAARAGGGARTCAHASASACWHARTHNARTRRRESIPGNTYARKQNQKTRWCLRDAKRGPGRRLLRGSGCLRRERKNKTKPNQKKKSTFFFFFFLLRQSYLYGDAAEGSADDSRYSQRAVVLQGVGAVRADELGVVHLGERSPHELQSLVGTQQLSFTSNNIGEEHARTHTYIE